MGYHSSPLLTVVMTLFNARLGCVAGQSPGEGQPVEAPRAAVRCATFIDEALGLTSDDNSWIYLSDGGHFENLGLYEMVLRRCHCIIVSDAGADPRYTYEDLGNAVRKIRVDFGISIEFDDSMPMSSVRKTGAELIHPPLRSRSHPLFDRGSRCAGRNAYLSETRSERR